MEDKCIGGKRPRQHHHESQPINKVQGHLAKFEDVFPTMKLGAQKEKEGLTVLHQPMVEKPPPPLSTPDREPADTDTDPQLLDHSEALNLRLTDSGFLKANIITIVWSRKKPIAN